MSKKIIPYFRCHFLIRLIMLGITIYLTLFCISNGKQWTYILIAGIASACQLYFLIRFVEQPNYHLIAYLDAIRYRDFSPHMQHDWQDRVFKELNLAYDKAISALKKINSSREVETQYFETIVKNLPIGLIAFDERQQVDLFNRKGKEILNLPSLKSLKRLKQKYPDLYHYLVEPTQKIVAVYNGVSKEPLELMLHGSRFSILNRKYTLVAFQNIRHVLEEKEMDAWQNLIRVLTHEMMNSLTPISSLAETAQSMLDRNGKEIGFNEDYMDIQKAIQTIVKRSKGLLHFVENYRTLVQIPEPQIQKIELKSLITRIQTLLKNMFDTSKIDFQIEIHPHNMKIKVDPALLEQVLINILNNALDAVKTKNEKVINLFAKIDEMGLPLIEIKDNGIGITPSALEKIFIPFFTTKQGGHGIGMSLARQIMRLHGGNIAISSTVNEGTCVTLYF